MTVLPIVTLPDPILRSASEAVTDIDDDVHALAGDLVDTLKANTLLGMAAIMVGIRRRVAILAVDAAGGIAAPVIMINPERISATAETEPGPEGCPSVPGIFETVERPSGIVATWRDLSGQRRTISATGLQARVIQHQIDLCDGILFIDRLSRLKRERIERKLHKATRRQKL